MKPLTLIAAVAPNGVIGRENRLPWNIPSEYQHFLGLIKGHIILMGRVSYEIFGPDLKTTTNLVLSRSAKHLPGATVFPALNDAIIAAQDLPGRLFCGGGGQVYRQTIGMADSMLLSYIHGEYTGDSHFPDFNPNDFQEQERVAHSDFDFVSLARIRGK
jgi:dihydrofolate reductase